MGDTFRRPYVRHAENIHSTGVLESLIGGSKILDLSVHGRRMTRPGGHAEWFLMDISPVYNTWNVEYESGHSDANLGRAGHISGFESSTVPSPRANLHHPSTLIYYDHMPIWGRRGLLPDDYLPGSVAVLGHEVAPATRGEPDWQAEEGAGDLARIELVRPEVPGADGTAIFDLSLRMCLFYELRYQGEPHFRFHVDAVKQGEESMWSTLTVVGAAAVGASRPDD